MVSHVQLTVLRELAAVTANRSYVLSTAELGAAGFTSRTVGALVRCGWLTRLRRGVYAVGVREPSDWQRAVGAWLATGRSSVVSHRSAARSHRFPHLLLDGPPEVTVVGGSHPRLPGVTVHRVGALEVSDVESRHGVPVTSASRTLIDLAPRLPLALLVRVIDEGCVQRLWTTSSLVAARRRTSDRRRLTPLDEVLGLRAPERPADSGLEIRVAAALSSVGTFVAHHQIVLDGRLVVIDLAHLDLQIAVECDGWAFHGRSRGRFDYDRRRDHLLGAHGWTVVRVTSAMSDDEVRAAVVRIMLRVAAERGRPARG